MKKLILIPLLYLLTIDSYATQISPPIGLRFYEHGVAPNFTVKDIDGNEFSLGSTRGEWVFLHFWASWCGPCVKELPMIESLIDEMKDEKLKILMINTAEDEDTIFTFLGTLGIDIETLMDRDGTVTEKYKPRGLPTTFLIDPEGKFRYQAIGGRPWTHSTYLAFMRKLISRENNTK